jgi:hypothetical protein
VDGSHAHRAQQQGIQMRTITRGLLAAVLMLSMSACVTTNAARLGTSSANRPVVPVENVALYRLASQVPRPYEEVALLNSSGDSGFTDEAKMFQSMKKKAGEMGANGVILDAVSEPGSGAKVAAAIFGVSAQRKGKALAIWIFPVGQAPAQGAVVDRPVEPPATAPCVSCGQIGKGF